MPSTLKPFLGVATKESDTEDIREIFRRAEEEAYQKKFLTRKVFLRSLISILVHRFYEEEKIRQRQMRVGELIQKMGEKRGWEEEEKKKLHFLNLLWVWEKMFLPEHLKEDGYPLLREELVEIYPEFEEQASPFILRVELFVFKGFIRRGILPGGRR